MLVNKIHSAVNVVSALVNDGSAESTGRTREREPCSQVTLTSHAHWQLAAALSFARVFHTATLLNDGSVLVVGGVGASGHLASAERFYPDTQRWQVMRPMPSARFHHSATLLTSGCVLIVGGFDGHRILEALLYDPSTNVWRDAGALYTTHGLHSATLLRNGQVLVVGAHENTALGASAERYDPLTNAWVRASAPNSPREQHTATLLNCGELLVVGGSGSAGAIHEIGRAHV